LIQRIERCGKGRWSKTMTTIRGTSDASNAMATSAHGTRALFRPEGEYWTIAFGSEVCRLRDSAGLRYLAVLLGRPGKKVLAADLAVLAGRVPADRALTDRERARVRITHAIRTTMRRLALHHAALSEHLRATVSTGTYCAYQPDPRRLVEWELGT
jgi:hypothetical protein